MQLDRADDLHPVQEYLWSQLCLPNSPAPVQWQQQHLSTCLAAARVLSLRQAEVQQLVGWSAVQQPINPRNEAAALALLLKHQDDVCGSSTQRQQELQELLESYPTTTSCPADTTSNSSSHVQQPCRPFKPGSPEELLHKWVLEQGATSSLTPALLDLAPSSSSALGSNATGSSAATCSSSHSGEGEAAGAAAASAAGPAQGKAGLRGCAGSCDRPAGSTVLQVPAHLLITYRTAAASDFGKALSRLPGLDPETLAVIWTMVDRHDPDSPHAPFWAALPGHFGTALSVPEGLFSTSMRGLPVQQEAAAARAHVRQQYAALQQTFKVLLAAYAAHLQASWFTEQEYLWAVELWYAYAIQVKFPSGSIEPALVPFASLINHSPWPHVVHFSTVDPENSALQLTTFRPVREGQQVFLSYGPLPNAQLLLFYGFALPHNPFEEVQLQVQAEQVQQLLAAMTMQQHHLQASGERIAEGQLTTLGMAAAAEKAASGDGSSSAKHGDASGAAQPGRKQLAAAKAQLMRRLRLGLSYTLRAQQPLPHGLLPCLRLLCIRNQEELQQLQQAVEQLEDASVQEGTVAAENKHSSKQSHSSRGSRGKSNMSSTQATSVSGAEQVQQLTSAWAAAARQTVVLGLPISSANEAAVQYVLKQLLLEVAKDPASACLTRLEQRQHLQAKLGLQEQAGDLQFLGALQVYAEGIVQLCDACEQKARV